MTAELPEDDRLFDEAVDLVIRLQNDPDNPVAVERARRWRMQGPAHEAVWDEVMEIHGLTGKVLADERKAGERTGGPSRRAFVIGGLAVTGTAAAGMLAAPDLIVKARADHVTATAELRRIILPDGSAITLGPDSAVAVRFDAERRKVDLLEGMLFVEVAPEAVRPFSVESGHVVATATGTSFDVSSDADVIMVGVASGTVAVENRDAAGGGRFDLGAGEWIAFDESGGPPARGERDATQIAAWREALIIADRERIASVVARIARWHPGRVVMVDPALGRERISGVFDLRDPALALGAVVHPYGARVRHVTPYLTVISPI